MADRSQQRLLIVAPIPEDLRSDLGKQYALVDYDRAKGLPAAEAARYDIAVTTSMFGADRALMDALPGIRHIACQGVGLDKIDLAEATARGVSVSYTPDVLTEDTGDFAIALMYAVARRTTEADRFVRDGRWGPERMTPGRRLFGKNCGIIGLGKIGQAIARRAAGIGMTVLYNGPRQKSDVPYDYVPSVETLAERSDVLIAACPGGESTRGIVSRAVLAKLGKDGILVNIARGSVVDEEALIEALQRKTIWGAGLDVFASEPELDERFKTLSNAVLSPHWASTTFETRRAVIDRILSDIAAFMAGKAFENPAARFIKAS